MKSIKKLIKQVVDSIKAFFAKWIISLFAKVFMKYPEGIQTSFKSFRMVYQDYPEFRTYIVAMYKAIAEDSLQLDVSLKPVKKGSEKYHVIVCKDRNLKTVFSLKRHGSNGEITDKKASYTEIVKG